MTVWRALPLMALLIALPLAAHAQFGGMPGMPGSPGGFPGSPGGGQGGFGPQSGPPPACQQLLSVRDEVEKSAGNIRHAGERKASPVEICKLFRVFLSNETKMMKLFAESGPQCGAPAQILTDIKKGHANATKIANQVCEAAARGSRPATPSLSDAFGTGGITSDNVKKDRGSAFDSLTGNVLAR